MKAMYRVGYFLILITVLIPISVDYAMQGGLAASWLLWFATDTVRAVLLYRVTLLLLQLGTFIGCVLFLRSYVPEKNGSLLVLLGTALYMLSPIRFYVCYDLVDFAVAGASIDSADLSAALERTTASGSSCAGSDILGQIAALCMKAAIFP